MRSQLFVRVTIQTIGRIDTKSDAVNDFLSWAVMTGRTGADTVGGNIMYGALNSSPVGDRMTLSTCTAWCFKGEITSAPGDGMSVGGMGGVKGVDMTAGTIATGREVLTDRQTDQTTVDIVTINTGRMG